MLAGEIPVDGGVVITDGLTLLFSPESFGLSTCMLLSSAEVGGVLLDNLRRAESTENEPVVEPFALEKVASTLSKLCKEHEKVDNYKHSTITFHDATFNTSQLVNAFEAVGARACGFLARRPDLFDGATYMVIEPEDCDATNDIYAILLQIGGGGD